MSWFVRLYNWFHKWRMRNQRMRIDSLRDIDLVSLNTLDKITPLLREQLSLISPRDLNMVNNNDLYQISVPVYFLQYYFYKEWLKSTMTTISTDGNKEGKGYINLDNKVPGYTKEALEVRLSNWIPIDVIETNGINLVKLYEQIGSDLNLIEKVMTSVSDPFFKNYYDKRLAIVLQDVLLVLYTINEMVAFYEWRR